MYCLHIIVRGDKIEKNEMGRACSRMGEKSCTQGFDGEA